MFNFLRYIYHRIAKVSWNFLLQIDIFRDLDETPKSVTAWDTEAEKSTKKSSSMRLGKSESVTGTAQTISLS